MIEPGSATWETVVAWVKQQREHAQTKVASHGLPITETEYHRGRLAVLAQLESLPNSTEPVRQGRPVLFTE